MATKGQPQPQASGQGYPAYPQGYYQQPPPGGYQTGGYAYPQPYQPAYGYYGQPPVQGQAATPYGAGEGAYPAPPPAAYAYQQQEAPATYGKTSSLQSTLPPGASPGAIDIETGSQMSDMITPDVDRAIRHAFVRKVYVILSIQVLFTFGVAAAFTLVDPMRTWLRLNSWCPVAFSFAGLILMIFVTCFPDLGRRVPLNFILLSLITGCFSMMIAFGGAATESDAFFLAVGITFVVVLALTVFACQTKIDFTGCGPYILVAMICLMMFGIFCIFWYNRVANLIYASLASLLFSFLLVYDTQQVVGGKHRKFQYSIDDYIFAALSLYMDIIGLFMNILSLLSNS
ncbi:N-methyl-D-aspartate receptor-associated protein [Toxoplasma gondii GAB2-2007-GAL-DOM2]|uniref:Glutamate [NMDA] receptor-associated protein 1 n=10 Tax=Toxoplasma gondii TaxID=5811 RepID=B9PUF8_TOXGV|nr:N-methyl-D-aspartate receptor-associated protein [Toxoplasma gondii GT1]ESS32929.1 N-methyl-D-aspartate receptor-associated protein [Toxoplasma gondii VEG]KAF4642869.1 N-methyl-D-aspartate receptor-associated protein [Toxoplasma gondii]KFG37710.1 N-methyl-D-aspartate receptor-associated protein [Toxoplasma gondii GAB2-2007-GAL-DOM2]KFG46012.1 N-methyl-D-aspartate receptor-associated protein [Toxoplasma gondii p89]KFG53710.1 N-methyl-D-aspartate receptor-associated protein [Toxoplasma gondii